MTSTADLSTANLELVRGVYAAFDRRDLPSVLDAFAPDIDWVHPEGMVAYGVGGTKVGHEGVKSFLAKVPSVLAGQQVVPEEFVVDGDRIVVLGSRHVTAHNGRTGTLRFVHSWTLCDGRVTRLEDVFDTAEMHRLIAD
ncbi:nuclear transport factor 2 family protein [Streptacidiphilus sp. MAP5-3]|uniref:nuclear transport factor 2 family protein n=1 Tax=unclassified Streptacidiphilus TaxID=2643834 RepID=UPI0035139CC5